MFPLPRFPRGALILALCYPGRVPRFLRCLLGIQRRKETCENCHFVTHSAIGSTYAIYGNIYHQYTPNVSIYTSSMDPMGNCNGKFWIYRILSRQNLKQAATGFGRTVSCILNWMICSSGTMPVMEELCVLSHMQTTDTVDCYHLSPNPRHFVTPHPLCNCPEALARWIFGAHGWWSHAVTNCKLYIYILYPFAPAI